MEATAPEHPHVDAVEPAPTEASATVPYRAPDVDNWDDLLEHVRHDGSGGTRIQVIELNDTSVAGEVHHALTLSGPAAPGVLQYLCAKLDELIHGIQAQQPQG